MIFEIPDRPSETVHFPLKIHVVTIGNARKDSYRPKGREDFLWFYCDKGSAEVVINKHKSVLVAGQGFLVFPNIPYSIHAGKDGLKEYSFTFSGNAAYPVLQELGMGESGVYQFFDLKIFAQYVRRIRRLYQSNPTLSQAECSKLCYSLLVDLSQCLNRVRRSVTVRENECVMAVITYLEDHFASPITLDELAGHMKLTKGYLCRLFKEAVGVTIITELTYIRLGRARVYLIQYPEKRISEIASMCGFESSGYFGRVFRKIEGKTPEQFRANPR